MDKMQKKIICTLCPRSCTLHVTVENTQNADSITVTHNACPKGIAYGKQEAIEPRRILTSTVKTTGLKTKRIAVKTSKAIPLIRMKEYMQRIHRLRITRPYQPGDSIQTDFLEKGIELLASGDTE